jgi:hypothetical protein
MTEHVTVHLLIRLPNGKQHEIGHLTLNPADLRDGLADALEEAAAEIRADGLADRR